MFAVNTSKRQKFGNAFVKFSAPIMAPSHSIRPFARRLSLPARRFSESFVTAVATPFRTQSLDFEPPSYFTPLVLTAEPSPFFSEDLFGQNVRAPETTEIVVEEVVCVAKAESVVFHPVRKVTKIRRVTRKMKSLLHFRQRSTAQLSS
jgi:hypothetical protein